MTSLTAASSSPHALTVSFEVIDAVQRTLEKEGILQSIRSQLRESVLRVISSVSASSNDKSSIVSSRALIHEKINPNIEMALILVRDLFESMNLTESLIAFKSEVQNQIALSTTNVGSDCQSLDWFSKGYKDTKNSLLLFSSNGSMNYHRDRELSLLEILIQLRQRDLSKETKDSGSDLDHAPAKKEQTPRWELSDHKKQKDDVASSSSSVRADEYKSAFYTKEDDLDEVDSELDIQYGHSSAAADDTDDAEGAEDDYVLLRGHVPAGGPAITAAAVTTVKTALDSQSVLDKDVSSSRLSMPLDMDESASFEDSNIELMSNSLNIDVSLPPRKQPLSSSSSTSSISGASSLPPLRAAGASSSLPPLKSQVEPRQSAESKEDESGPAFEDDENEDQDAGGPENLSEEEEEDGEEVSADPESSAATRASSIRQISVRDRAPSSSTASATVAASSASSRASVQRLGQGSTVSRSVSGWGQSDDSRYDDFEVDEEDRETDPISSVSRGSSVRSSFPSSIAAFPRPGAPGSSRGGPGASSLDSEDPLLEEILDDVNASEQSQDQMQTSYRSNQEDEEDYFAQARRGRDRYDSKHEEKEEEEDNDDDDEDEDEEAPSPMARDLDALSKMSSLRADEGGDKPSRRPEEKPEQNEAGSEEEEEKDNYADDNYGDDFEDDDVNALLDDDRVKPKKQPQSWTADSRSSTIHSQNEVKKPLQSRSADEDEEAEEVQSVEDDVSAAHSDSDEDKEDGDGGEEKGTETETETGFGLARSRSGGLLSGLPSLHPGVKQPTPIDNDDSFEQSEGSSYFPGSLGLGSRTQKDDTDVVRNSASFNLGQYSVDNEQDDEDISGEEVEGKISDIDKRLRELENMDKDGELVALKKKFTAPDSYSPRASVDRDDDDDEEEEENVMEFSVGEDDEVEDEF